MTVLVDGYDAALFDLDGVVYLGPDAVPGAATTIAALRERNVRVGFVTNNAARSPQTVAEHLNELGIASTAADVVTSAQAVARLMAGELPSGASVLVAGTPALLDEVRAAGLVPVPDSTHRPAAVVVGYAPELTWEDLNEVAYAVQQGAAWYGCNPDRTRPTNRGLAIGMGAVLDLLGEVLPARTPTLAGKPYRPLLDETVRRLGATHPVFVGDRLDTDIEGANRVGMDSLFVLSGSHGPADLMAAPPHQRPTYLAEDLAGLLLPPVRLRPELVRRDGDTLVRTTPDADRLELIWAAADASWRAADEGVQLRAGDLLSARRRCRGCGRRAIGSLRKKGPAMRPTSPARDLGLIAVFAALIAAASIAPGVPIGPVPITLQTLAVMLTGLVLGPWRGFAATALYVVVGLAGLPVFTGGVGGLAILAKPSIGYLLSFPFAALVAGALAAVAVRRTTRWLPATLTGIAALTSLLVIHPPGIVGLMVNAKLTFTKALTVDLAFVPGDLAKALLAGVIAATVHRAFPALLGRALGRTARVTVEAPLR